MIDGPHITGSNPVTCAKKGSRACASRRRLSGVTVAMKSDGARATARAPADFIATVTPERRRRDAHALLPFFAQVTGFEPVMWGPSIIGYGRYHYVYDSGREG